MIEVLKKVTRLGETVERAVMGDTADYKGLVQENRIHYETFMKEIRDTCPDFLPVEQRHDVIEGVLDTPTRDVIHLNDVREIIEK